MTNTCRVLNQRDRPTRRPLLHNSFFSLNPIVERPVESQGFRVAVSHQLPGCIAGEAGTGGGIFFHERVRLPTLERETGHVKSRASILWSKCTQRSLPEAE